MNRAELVKKISDREGLPAFVVDQAVGSFVDVVIDTLMDGESITLRGFGRFEPRPKQAVTRINPSNGQPIQVPARLSMGFTPSRTLKETLNADNVTD